MFSATSLGLFLVLWVSLTKPRAHSSNRPLLFSSILFLSVFAVRWSKTNARCYRSREISAKCRYNSSYLDSRTNVWVTDRILERTGQLPAAVPASCDAPPRSPRFRFERSLALVRSCPSHLKQMFLLRNRAAV